MSREGKTGASGPMEVQVADAAESVKYFHRKQRASIAQDRNPMKTNVNTYHSQE